MTTTYSHGEAHNYSKLARLSDVRFCRNDSVSL